MTKRGLHKYVDDLLDGRRPRPFAADEFDAAQLRTAIELRAARDEEPRAEFVDALKGRIAEQLSTDGPGGPPSMTAPATRRQVIVGTTAAAGAAIVAVSVDRLVGGRSPEPPAQEGPELVPNDGSWQAVAQSAEVVDAGDMRKFDLGTVTGFVRRIAGRVEAVSGVCTHQGCKLWFDGADDRLRCPCHTTSFSPAGQVITHQLPIAPKPLPHFEVREHDGVIEVLAPQPPSELA